MKSLRTRLTFTHALVAIIAVAIVAVLATVLIRAAFNRFAPQAAANNLADQLSDRNQLIFDSAGPAQRRLVPKIPGGTDSPIIVDSRTVGLVVISADHALLNQ